MAKKIIEEEKTAIVLPDEAQVVISIKSQEDMTRATAILSTLNKYLDYLTEQKEKLTKPLNSALKEIRSRYKEPETKLENKINEIRRMMTEYQTRQIAIQQKKEAELAKKVEEGKLSIEKASERLNNLPSVPTNTVTNAGSVKFKPIKKFKVVSLAELPIEYHLANESAIRTAMLEGTELQGVQYYVEQVPYNSR